MEEAIRGLSRFEQRSLALRAELYAQLLKATGQTADDLLQEAMERTLAHARSWNRGTDLVLHLRQVMRSVADSWYRQGVRRRKRMPLQDLLDSQGRARGPDLESGVSVGACAVHEPTEDPRFLEFLVRLKDRLHAKKAQVELDLLEGIAIGYSSLELREVLGLSRQAHESALKRIRRTALKLRQEVL